MKIVGMERHGRAAVWHMVLKLFSPYYVRL